MSEMNAAKRKGLRFVLGATVATLMVSVAAPANATIPDVTPPSLATMNEVLIGSGSDTTYDLMKGLDAVYEGANGCATIWVTGQPKDGTCDPAGAASGNDVAAFPWVNSTHDTVSEAYPVGSGKGIAELCNQGLANVRKVDFARSSSGKASSAASAPCKDLMYIAYAKDAVSWWHETDGTSADVADLSIAVLKAIYTGTAQTLNCVAGETNATWDGGATCPAAPSNTISTVVNQWSDLNGLSEVKDGAGNNFPVSGAGSLPASDIYVYTSQAGSGTVDYWLKQLGGGTTAITVGTGSRFIDTVQENNPNFVQADANHANGIYFMSYGRFRQNAGTTAVYDDTSAEYTDATHNTALGKINGIAPSHGPILASSGGFTNSRNVYNVLRYPTEKVLKYIGPEGMLCSATIGAYTDRVTGKTYRTLIDDAIKREGFVPLTLGATTGASFDGKYGLSATMSSTSGYCRVSTLAADYTDTTAPTLGIDTAAVTGATFAFDEPVVSVDTSMLGIQVKDATTGLYGAYLSSGVTYTCKNLKLVAVDCDGDTTNRYGDALISKVVVTADSDLSLSTITYAADANVGYDRNGNGSSALANANPSFTFVAQSVVVPSKIVVGRNSTVARQSNAGQAVSLVNRTPRVCKVVRTASTYRVVGLKKNAYCRLSLTAAGVTAGDGTIYNAYAKTLSYKVRTR